MTTDETNDIERLIASVPTDTEDGVLLRQMWTHAQNARAQQTDGPPTLGGDMTIAAVPSWYAGIVFRSKLEADWAATLDEWRIPWEYEPETITLPSGATYIPDFWLPEHGTWLEVKGTGVPRIEKAIELGKTRACHCDDTCTCRWPGGEFVLIGHPPTQFNPWADHDPDADHRPWWAIERASWNHHGHINWSNTTGRTTWLTLCLDCERGGWVGGGTLVRCRACGSRMPGGRAYNPGDPELLFIDSSCHVAPVRPIPPAA